MPDQLSTVDVPPLSVRADVGSVNEEARTVDVVFSTGAAVDRFDWFSGKRYVERLSMKPEHIKLERLNSGAPLLNSHSSYDLFDQIGVVESNSAKVVRGEARATIRFSKRDAVDEIWKDVRDGIYKSVSVGYRVYRFEETEGKDGGVATRLATSWEPFEISLVSMPADAGAQVRAGDKSNTNPCVIVTHRGESNMANPEQSETLVEQSELVQPAEPVPHEPNDRDAGVAAERVRVQGIMNACRAVRLPQAFADGLIESGIPLLEAQTRVFTELGARDMPGVGPRPGAAPPHQTRTGQQVMVGDDPLVHTRAGIENAILHRTAPGFFKLDDNGRRYRGMGLLDVARLYLNARGERTTDLSKMELAGLALGLSARGGMHTTSDFPLLLADVTRKTLRAAYEEAEQTFKLIGRRVTLPDFKTSNRLQLGDAPALLEVKEHAEFTRGTITEGKEALTLKTYGRVFAITRQALVNDDVDAFSRVPTMFGRSARTLEADLVWAQITSNPTMGDGNALFSTAHGNYTSSGTAISVDSLGVARALMRVQKGIDGVTVLNVTPKYLAVPAAKETLAATFLTQITPAQASTVNPFAGLLTPIVEPRLDAASTTAWYLFAAGGVDIIEYAYLEGEEGPMVEERIGFDIDGLEIKCRLDFGAKVIDWRGAYKNVGA